MSQSGLTLRSPPDPAPEYASSNQVRAAIKLLNDRELKKLQLIAEFNTRHFGIPNGHMEPGDLLNEAIRRTLGLEKKWRKGVSIMHHLSRAMENIAGHEVPKLARRLDAAGSQPDIVENDGGDDPLDSLQKPNGPDGTVFAQVDGRERLHDIENMFRDDEVALRVLKCRAAGQEGKEIQDYLKLTNKQYEATSKRILRKIQQYYEPKSQASHPGRGA